MTSVNPPNPPNFNGINYNSSFWTTSQTGGLTYNQIAKQFLKFPVAQGTETVFDLNVQGELTISGTGNGVTFPDDTKQTTAFIEANYAQLNTDNTFLSPYQNTFQGSNLSGPTTGPIKISNVSSGEYGTLYVDPNPNSDLTLYSNQGNSGGLTVRNATNSFTINPATINGSNNWANFLNPINSTLGINAGYVNINGTSSSTLNVYAPSSTINYTQIQQNSASTIISNSYWAGAGGGIYFELKSDSTNYYSPFNITSGLVQCLPPLSCSSAITATQFTTGSTTITQSPTLNPQIVSFTNSYNGTASPQFYFQMQNTTNTGYFAPLQIVNTGITASVDINMNNNDINNCNSVNSSGTLNLTGTSVLINGSPIPSTAGFAILNTATAQTFTGPIYLSGNTTASTQPPGTNNTTLATTAFVQSVLPVTTITGASNFIAYLSMPGVVCTTLQQGGFVNFNGCKFTTTIISTSGINLSNPILLCVSFSAIPFPQYPPLNVNSVINGYCSNGTTYQFTMYWNNDTTTATLQCIPKSVSVPLTVGTQYTFTLGSYAT